MLIAGPKEWCKKYTLESRTYNPFSNFPKKFRLYCPNPDRDHVNPNEERLFPLGDNNNARWYVHHQLDAMKYLNYKGTPTDEQAYIFNHITTDAILSGTIMMKTGRGKTHLLMQLVCHLKVPTLILCHNIDTTLQTKKQFLERTNTKPEHISALCSKTKDKPTSLIDISTHAGFRNNRKQWKDKYRLIIYDECDYNISYPYARDYEGAMTTALIRSGADIMFGLSGTPFKQDAGAEGVTLLFGKLIQMPDQPDNGYNMIPNINRVLYQNQSRYLFETRPQLRVAMYEDEVRFKSQLRYINEASRKYNLVLFENVNETELYYEELKRQSEYVAPEVQGTEQETTTTARSKDGVSNSHFVRRYILLHGQLSTTEYKEQLLRLHNYRESARESDSVGRTIVATADKIGRGVDIPEIDTIFMFFPAKFKGTVVQAVGRALRHSPGKEQVIIHDWCDLPLLKRQAAERKKAYLQEYGQNILITDTKLHGEPHDNNTSPKDGRNVNPDSKLSEAGDQVSQSSVSSPAHNNADQVSQALSVLSGGIWGP